MTGLKLVNVFIATLFRSRNCFRSQSICNLKKTHPVLENPAPKKKSPLQIQPTKTITTGVRASKFLVNYGFISHLKQSKNWMGLYQRTPKQVTGAIRYSGIRGPFSGYCWDFLDSNISPSTWIYRSSWFIIDFLIRRETVKRKVLCRGLDSVTPKATVNCKASEWRWWKATKKRVYTPEN